MKYLVPALVLIASAPAWAPAVFVTKAETVALYVKLQGAKTPKFSPDAPSDKFRAVVVNHEEQIAPRAGSGQATGRRQYRPIIIRKDIDKSSPLLARALATNESIKNATFEFYRPAGPGQVEIYKTIHLENTSIKSIRKAGNQEIVTFTEWNRILTPVLAPAKQGVNDWKNQ